jgi:hypothetical protein
LPQTPSSTAASDDKLSLPARARLEDQINWYERNSQSNKRAYKLLRSWTIIAAAAVPVFVACGIREPGLAAFFAATIAVAEGLQHLNQFHANWLSYRATCEALKHEKFLFEVASGVYGSTNAVTALTERTEAVISQENAKWIALSNDEKATT